MKKWPVWWAWDLELSPHVQKRMIDRGFSETDLRRMMDDATGFRRSDEPGRWVVETTHGKKVWNVVVEPDDTDETLVVITGYPVEP